MQPHPLAKLIRLRQIWLDLGEILLDLDKNQNLSSQKHSISYGYAKLTIVAPHTSVVSRAELLEKSFGSNSELTIK